VPDVGERIDAVDQNRRRTVKMSLFGLLLRTVDGDGDLDVDRPTSSSAVRRRAAARISFGQSAREDEQASPQPFRA